MPTHRCAFALAVLIAVSTLIGSEEPTAAQPAPKIARLGYLTNDSVSVDAPRRNALKEGLRDLGYIEGQTIAIDYRVASGDSTKLPELMRELLRLKPDVIFAFTTSGILAAKNATRDVPIVFVGHTPVELGIVKSLGRPGGNMTGLSLTAGPEIYGKYLEILSEVVPRVSRVAAMSNPTNPGTPVQLKETQSAARALGVTVLSVGVARPEELDRAFTTMKKERVDAFVVLADAMLLGERRRIGELGVKAALPSVYGIPEHVEAGGLIGYAASRPEAFRRAAIYVDKILKGTRPNDLPIEQPTKFDLLINQKTAKALGLTIPPSLLLRAERIIE